MAQNYQPSAPALRRAAALCEPKKPRPQLPNQSARRIVALKFQKRQKGTLQGFVDLELPSGLRLLDCTVHARNDKHWVFLPGRPTLDKNYELRKDPNGRILYAPLGTWRDKETSEKFSRLAVEALLEKFPDAFEPEAAP
jgi:hypothetical protein